MFTDLDESINRVVVGVRPSALERVAARLAAAGLPESAVRFQTPIWDETDPTTYPIEDNTPYDPNSQGSGAPLYLNSRHGIVAGGAKISFLANSKTLFFPDGTPKQVQVACTAGVIATTASGARRLLTASHCSKIMGQVDGRGYYQPAIANFQVGQPFSDIAWAAEHTDAPFYFQLNCIGCKKADALLASILNEATAGFARIHRPLAVSDAWTVPGLSPSVQIDATQPTFTIVRPAAANTYGEIIDKVGQRSGWTRGPVTRICVDVFWGTLKRVKCATWAALPAFGGDSGAPVFRWLAGVGDGSQVEFLGIMSTSNEVNESTFSPMSQIQAELGPLTVATP